MKLNEPIGDSMWGAFFVRLTLGGYLVFSGLAHLENMGGFVQEVQRYKLLPSHLATLYGILIPYLQIAAGSLLVVGFWTTLGAIFSVIILASFVAFLGVFPTPHRYLINKDLILLAAAISLLYSGAGALSLDRFRKTG